MNKRERNILILALVFIFVVAWIGLMYFVGPQTIVDRIGVKNGYLIIFLIALLGGTSTLTSTSYIAALATFAAGGLNPFLLGVLAGTALTLGDSLIFYLGTHGSEIVLKHESAKNWLTRLIEWIKKQPPWAVPILIFLYSGFTPFPMDILSFPLGLAKYPFKRFLPAVFLGTVNSATLISLFSQYFLT